VQPGFHDFYKFIGTFHNKENYESKLIPFGDWKFSNAKYIL